MCSEVVDLEAVLEVDLDQVQNATVVMAKQNITVAVITKTEKEKMELVFILLFQETNWFVLFRYHNHIFIIFDTMGVAINH